MKYLVALSLIVSLCVSPAKAIDPVSLSLAPAAVGVGAALLTKGKDMGTQAAAIGGGVLLTQLYVNHQKTKQARSDFQKYQLGKYQEAWVRANTDWYYSTLDRRSGLPTAFDGYWAMYVGLPDIERQVAEQRSHMAPQVAPANREAYIAYLAQSAQVGEAQGSNASDLASVPVVTATMPERSVNGIKFRAQKRDFPTLP